MSNQTEDRSERLAAAFEATRAEVQTLPSAEQQTRARAQFLLDARSRNVSQTGDVRLKDQTRVLSDLTLQEGEQRMKRFYARQTRMIAAVILGIIVAGGFWAAPDLRAFAQSVLNFFTPAGSDAVATMVPLGDNAPRPAQALTNPYALSLDELASQADFARLPTSLPSGYQFDDASYQADQQKIVLQYICDQMWSLTVIEERTNTPATPQEVGASAKIEDVPIRATTGQYVRGAWLAQIDQIGTAEPSDQGMVVSVPRVWTAVTDWQQLVWREDGINFLIASSGSIGQIDAPATCALNKDSFALVAQSLQPTS